MPSLKKFDANVIRHVKLMDKNLCANLIRNEYIVTTVTKAKRAQPKIERFLALALKDNQTVKGDTVLDRVLANELLNFLQPPDKVEVGLKVIEELAQRYPDRKLGFTRVIKLEPRLGEDKAPMAVLELVDLGLDVKFWYTDKIVARLQLQGLELDDITKHNMEKLIKFKGEQAFTDAVEVAKREFFKVGEDGEVTDADIKKNLENTPASLAYNGGELAGTTFASKKFPTKARPEKEEAVIPPSPFAQ